jgi:nitrite reductase/ring-hydroxylating ferredoxin subunit
MARTRIAQASAVEPGTGTVVEAGGRTLALFNVDGTFHVIDNSCPHRGGPLGDGPLTGAIVTCPWHGYRYDVRTGVHQLNPRLNVTCYPVTVEGGVVYVDL